MNGKIQIDKKIEINNRGIYGIFITTCNADGDEQCAYIGKSEELSNRVKCHCKSILRKDHISTLNKAMDDVESRIVIRLIESVAYKFDDYYKDAQRLASRENYWIDKYQEKSQCLEQVPGGRRPSMESWEQLKKNVEMNE
jgi:hypothetical protein